MTSRAVTAAVAAGVRALDVGCPGWAQKINLVRLDLGDCCQCVLGQVFDAPSLYNPYSYGLWALNIDGRSREHGFSFEAEPGYTILLDKEWRRVIAARQGGAA